MSPCDPLLPVTKIEPRCTACCKKCTPGGLCLRFVPSTAGQAIPRSPVQPWWKSTRRNPLATWNASLTPSVPSRGNILSLPFVPLLFHLVPFLVESATPYLSRNIQKKKLPGSMFLNVDEPACPQHLWQGRRTGPSGWRDPRELVRRPIVRVTVVRRAASRHPCSVCARATCSRKPRPRRLVGPITVRIERDPKPVQQA